MISRREFILQKDPEWWDIWKFRTSARNEDDDTHIPHPFLGNVRFNFVRVVDIREKEQDFEAHVRVSVTIDLRRFLADDLPDSAVIPKRVFVHGDSVSFVTIITDAERERVSSIPREAKFVEEFNPIMNFKNLNSTGFKTAKWIRRNVDKTDGTPGYLVEYSMEVRGWFGTSIQYERYPIDHHELTVEVTSDWDEKHLKLQGQAPHQFCQEDQYELRREFEVFSKVLCKTEREQSSRGHTYHRVEGSVMASRKYWMMLALIAVRPFLVTTLGFMAYAIVPGPVDPADTSSRQLDSTDYLNVLTSRVTIVLVLLLASAVQPARSFTTFSYLDWYTGGGFLVLSLICAGTVLALSPNVGIPVDFRATTDRALGISIALFWGIINFLTIYKTFSYIEYRNKERRKFEDAV